MSRFAPKALPAALLLAFATAAPAADLANAQVDVTACEGRRRWGAASEVNQLEFHAGPLLEVQGLHMVGAHQSVRARFQLARFCLCRIHQMLQRGIRASRMDQHRASVDIVQCERLQFTDLGHSLTLRIHIDGEPAGKHVHEERMAIGLGARRLRGPQLG